MEQDGFSTLLIEQNKYVLTVSLNRVEVANAINETMLSELDRLFDEAAEDESIRVVVLRGSGRGFSGGHDRKEPVHGIDGTRDLAATRDRMLWLTKRIMRVWDFPKPTIASIHGYCIGAGAQLAACCDLTIVAEDAEIGIASIPTGGGYLATSWALTVGTKRAKQMALDYGSRIDGRTAVDWGWANTAVPSSSLNEETMRLAERIARVPSALLFGQKLAINRIAEFQGFLAGISSGIEIDLLMRTEPEVVEMRRKLKEDGLRTAIADFKASTSPSED
jgi:enoyl-CoA hydratase